MKDALGIQPQDLEKLILGNEWSISNPSGKLIHIYGKAGSGKTALALQFMIQFCLHGKKVLFIDTEGKISGIKIKEMASTEENFNKVNKLLKLYTLKNFTEQQKLIESLEFYLTNQSIGLIIIDTISNLYRQEMKIKVNDKTLYEKLAYQVAFLRKIAIEKKMVVLIFNQVTIKKTKKQNDEMLEYDYESINPVASAIMNYWADNEVIVGSHGWGKFDARKPKEFEGRVKFTINPKGIAILEE